MADLIDRGASIRFISNIERDDEDRLFTFEEIKKMLWDAPAVNRWIPCIERLPLGGRVLATTNQGYVVDVIFIAKGSQWFRNDEYFTTDTVIAWMPMPDAYKPPEKEYDDET